jgi:hypothetical protein
MPIVTVGRSCRYGFPVPLPPAAAGSAGSACGLASDGPDTPPLLRLRLHGPVPPW